MVSQGVMSQENYNQALELALKQVVSSNHLQGYILCISFFPRTFKLAPEDRGENTPAKNLDFLTQKLQF